MTAAWPASAVPAMPLPAAWENLASPWADFVATPLFGATLTLAAYLGANWLWRRTGSHAAANPIFLTIALTVAFLAVTGVSYENYMNGAQFIAFLLGPATVALALPLYRSDGRIREAAWAIGAGLLVGSFAAIVSAIVVVQLAGGDHELMVSMAPKSATTPVAIATAYATGGIPALTAAFTLGAGMLGAIVGPALLSLARVRDRHLRGLSMGLASHGIGTARMLHDEPGAAPFAALGMAANAILTPILVPLSIALLL